MAKKNIKAYILAQALTFLTGATLMASEQLLPNVTSELTTADYWITRLQPSGNQTMTTAQINQLNAQTTQNLSGIMVDLASIDPLLSPDAISKWIQTPSFPQGALFWQGNPLPGDFFAKAHTTMNLTGITGKIKYGITLRRADIRTFPTDCAVFDSPNDREFDNFQETAVNPGEALIILHQSIDCLWSYIQTANYRGWMATSSIAASASKTEWLAYQTQPHFLTVTDPCFILKDPSRPDASDLFYEMGAKIPIAALPTAGSKTYAVIIPTQNSDGDLSFKTLSIPVSDKLHPGYLPYSQAGLIRQAFKMLGQRYGWGGMFQGVDCSSFTMNIYRCFGIILPRNSSEQARSGFATKSFNQVDLAARHQIVSGLPAGSLLFLKGHVMFYLGTVNGRHYVINALSAYGQPTGNNQYQRSNVMQVTVNDLELTRTNGNTLLQSVTVAKSL